MEDWRDIPGYDGYYEVSNHGAVRSVTRTVSNGYGPENSVRTIKGRILKQGHYTNGYCFVVLCKHRIKKTFSVHRLVAQSFCPNPNNFTEVNHKDEDKNNNTAVNLEWCNRKYNANYGTCIQRRIATQKKKKLS